jgi:NAD+ diphosphatase
MQFTAGIEPINAENEEAAWWFAFSKDRLFVLEKAGKLSLPCVTDLSALGLNPVRRQYLGEWGGKSCYSAELPDDEQVKENRIFIHLMSCFEQMGEEIFNIAGIGLQIVNWDRTHQHCGACGSPTEDKMDERAKVCPRCGMHHFPRLAPAVIVAVTRGDKILLAHSGRFPGKFYSVLAGFVEPGETFEDCVSREIMEEVGIKVKNIRYFGSQPWPFPHSLMVGFTAEHAGGEIKVDDVEIKEAKWFGANELPLIPGKISIARKLIDWFVTTYPRKL